MNVPRRVAIVIFLCLAVVAALGPGPAHATLVRPFSLAELTDHAHTIVRGEVVDQEVVWDAARGELYTHSFVVVLEVLAGADLVGDLVVVRQIGGELDGLGRSVVGTAELALGDEVVVFARTDGAFHYLIGMAQGAFHVVRAPGRPVELVRQARPELQPAVGPARPVAPDALRFDALRSEVARLIAASAGGSR